MLEVEKKLGKRLAGRTTKAASLTRIAECLVSLNVFEAAPEEETMIITSKVPVMAHLRKYLVAAAVILLLAAGAAAYHFWIKAKGAPMLPRAVHPALPSTGAPLVTHPLETAPPAVLPETGTSTSTTTTTTTTSTTPPPIMHPVPSSISTSQSSSVLIGRNKDQTSLARKKTNTTKKKKKKASEQ